jgi:hypothetical protein
LSVSSEQIEAIKNKGILNINLKTYQQNLSQYLINASQNFSQTIAEYFNTSQELFEQSKIKFFLDEFSVDNNHEFEVSVGFGNVKNFILSYKESGSNNLSIAIAIPVEDKNQLPDRILEHIIGDIIGGCLFANILPKPFVVTSERTGIALFYKELDISKNAIIDHLTDSNKLDILSMINSIRSRYARPIHDNIDVVRDAENLSKRRSFLREDKQTYKSVLDALQDLLGGTFKVTNQQIVYQPKKERNRDKIAIPFYIASSAIKSLFLIDLYINCLAKKGELLIIDEPELNLHPDNQRKMGRLLARLVNAGVKVLITTHSDYLIRELNNCIMLHNDIDKKDVIMKKADLTDDDIINPEKVKGFVIKKDHLIHEVTVDRYGMNLGIFDELIAEANTLSDDIYYNIKE